VGLKIVRRPQTPELSLKLVQGLDMWKEYRLEEEGIENVENLATADVIELAVKTHYTPRTLVDWVDQAILIVRLRGRVDKLIEAAIALSAIEFAWRSPENGGSSELLRTIAKICNIDPLILTDLTTALYCDDYVRDLWQLWQGRIKFSGNVTKASLKEVPGSDVAQVVKDFESEGATVVKTRQPEGNWAVLPMFLDKPH
jgi:hypothetical protein